MPGSETAEKKKAVCETLGVLPGGALPKFREDIKRMEQEIRLKDLFTHFLQRWKSILAVTIICAAALGGWQFLGVKKAHDAGEKTKEEARYEQELTTYQANLANAQQNVEYLKGVLERRMTYRDHSLLMNLNPNDVWAAEKKYLVSDADGSAAEILAVYTGTMIADHDTKAVMNAFGTDNAGYANEIVMITADNAENSFTVRVWASEKETAEKGLAYVAQKIEETEKEARNLGEHTLKQLNEGVSKSVFPDLISEQNTVGEKIADDEDSVNRARRMLNNVLESQPFKPGDPVVRWAVTGAVLGFLAMIGIYLTTFLRKKER